MSEDITIGVSEPTITAIDCGVLTDITWPGNVSAKSLINEHVTSVSKIDQAVSAINDFYVAENATAKTRCIDGRHDPDLDEAQLGPQVPGGAPGAALAYRLGVDKDDLTRGTFLSDAEAMIANFIRLGFFPGGHRDERSLHESSVGCGAIDGMDAILATMTNPELVEDHKRVVKLLLGKDFNRDAYLRVMGAAVLVNGRSKEYFRDRESIIDILEKRVPKSTATLKGTHQECIVAINLAPNTTLSSNRFAESFGIQAFGYDLWRSKDMAHKLLPLPSQEVDRERFVMARVMSTVATLMALTDGSQRLVIRVLDESSIE